LTANRQEANVKIILALTLIHFIGDFYNAFIIPLLPLFIDKFALTLAQAGLVTGLSRFLAFVVQPPVGYLADGVYPAHRNYVLFLDAGPFRMSGFGGVFHVSSNRRRDGRALCRPAFWTGHVHFWNGRYAFICHRTAFYQLVRRQIRPQCDTVFNDTGFSRIGFSVDPSTIKSRGFIDSFKEIFGPVWLPIVLILLAMTLRAFVSQSFMTFLPVMVARQGYSLVAIGALVSLFIIAGAPSGLLAGHLSDRIGFKPVFMSALLLATPNMLALLYLPGNWVFLFVFLAGFFIMAPLPIGVALAQRLAPQGKSMASSLMMGLAVGMGGLLTPLTGKLADIFTIQPVLAVLAIIPLLTAVLIYFLFKKEPSPAGN
jgi:FSR family fosmidomycin resistance protein-like MFS transporter